MSDTKIIRGKIYLAGPMTGLTYGQCNDWREFVKRELEKCGIAVYSPMRAKKYLSFEKVITEQTNHILSSPKAIVTRDRLDCTTANVVLFYLAGAKRISIGTMIEYGWADGARIPIVTVMENSGNLHDHVMIREMSSYRVESLKGAINIIKSILLP